jgi:membrane protease YdiL (CAAX protease family)
VSTIANTPRLVRLAVPIYAAAALLAAVWAATRGLLPSWGTDTPLAAVGGGIGVGALGVLASSGLERVWGPIRAVGERFAMFLAGTTLRQALLLAAVSAVGEELLFRGVLQAEIGIVWASLLFGLVHVGPDRVFLAWTASATAMGFAFGGLYELWGVSAPIVAHFVINAVNLTLLGRRGARMQRDSVASRRERWLEV